MNDIEESNEKNKLVSVNNPISCYQVLVANASPEFLVGLHKMLGTIVEVHSMMMKKAA